MSIAKERQRYVAATINDIRQILENDVNVESLTPAKHRLMELAGQVELFPRTDFPFPNENDHEVCYRLSEDDDGRYALYLNSATREQSYRPHNHGDAWVVIAAIEGTETHWLYQQVDASGAATGGSLNNVGTLDVKPGAGITMLPGGIHSIQAQTDTLMHLHLYGRSFETQAERLEFDLQSNECFRFKLPTPEYLADME